MRVIMWFSHGAASAVATKIQQAVMRRRYGDAHELLIATIPIPSEHPDNFRFRLECEAWFGQRIIEVTSDRFSDTWEVWEKERYLVGPAGAPCTRALKTNPRKAFTAFWKPDMQGFGFTAEEADRADRFRRQNPTVGLITPLITAGLTKADCLGMLLRAGIEIPTMYRLGYRNNNCVGCVKGGAGYWNKIREDFPEVFARMAALERTIGAKLLKLGDKRVWLDELPPDAGRHQNPDIECSVLCVSAETELDAVPARLRGLPGCPSSWV